MPDLSSTMAESSAAAAPPSVSPEPAGHSQQNVTPTTTTTATATATHTGGQAQAQSTNHAHAPTPSSTPSEAIARLQSICISLDLTDVQFFTVPSHYYDLSLEERAALLGGETDVNTLCKSLLMTNSRHRHYTELSDAENGTLNPQHVLVLIQYQNARLHNERTARCIWANIGQSNTHIKRNKHFNMRLATDEVNAEKTGYTHNGVCPLGCRDESLRIVMSHRIAQLPYFYCGAGHVDAKMRINTREFIEKCNVVVGDITHDQKSSD